MQDHDVKLKLSLINGLLNYLGTRPYGEVFQLVGALHNEVQPQIQVPTDAEKPADAQVQ